MSGTKEPLDLITDVCLHSEPFQWRSQFWHMLTRTQDSKAHAGILLASRQLLTTHRNTIQSFADAGFEIILCGHSLGAGVASLMAVQLKESIPDVTCVGIASPPCLTRRAAEECSSYITTIVADDDLVARSSVHSLISLLNSMLQCPWREFLRQDLEQSLGGFVWDKEDDTKTDEPRLAPLPPADDRLFPPGKLVHLYRSRVANPLNDSFD